MCLGIDHKDFKNADNKMRKNKFNIKKKFEKKLCLGIDYKNL